MIKLNLEFDASFIYYLMELFGGNISFSEINNMPLSLLLAMKKTRENQLDEVAKRQKNK